MNNFRKIKFLLFCILVINQTARAQLCGGSVGAAQEVIRKKCPSGITLHAATGSAGGTARIANMYSKIFKDKFGIIATPNWGGSANGHIAATRVQSAQSDCEVLVTSNSNVSLNYLNPQHAAYKVGLNPKDQFTPVGLLTTSPFVLAYRKKGIGSPQYKDRGFENLADFKNPKREPHFYATAGAGGIGQLISFQFNQKLGLQDEMIAYTDSTKARNEGIEKGQSSYLFESPTSIRSSLKNKPDEIIIVGSTSVKEIQISGISNPIPPLSDVIPELGKDFKMNPYIGILARKIADPKFVCALEFLTSEVVKSEPFAKPLQLDGYSIANGTAAELQIEIDHYLSPKVVQAYKKMTDFEDQLNGRLTPPVIVPTPAAGR